MGRAAPRRQFPDAHPETVSRSGLPIFHYSRILEDVRDRVLSRNGKSRMLGVLVARRPEIVVKGVVFNFVGNLSVEVLSLSGQIPVLAKSEILARCAQNADML